MKRPSHTLQDHPDIDVAAPPALPLDEFFEMLSDQRRRDALAHLIQQGRPVRLENMARQVTAWETDSPPESIPWDAYRRVFTSLYVFDLPALADAGMLSYDSDDRLVRYSDNTRYVEEIFALLENG